MILAQAAIISLVSPRDRRSSSAPSVVSESTYSRSLATVHDFTLSKTGRCRSSRMRRVTASCSGGTTGFSWSSPSVTSASTRLAAIRSETLSAASPASRSPDFSSLALARTCFRSRNR